MPPNPGSLAFHRRLGFRPVGRAWNPQARKRVVFLVRAPFQAVRSGAAAP